MDVDFAFVCDDIEAAGQKIDARGIGFDEIYAPEIPWVAAEFWYVAQLNGHTEDVGQHELRVEVVDADGQLVAELVDTFDVGSPRPGEDTKARIAVNLGGVVFPRNGGYALRLLADDRELHVTSLSVRPPPE